MKNVLNLLGSEELAGCVLPAGSFGVDQTGSLLLSTAGGASRDDRERTSTACLKLDDAVVGALAILSLLQQKSGLEPVDRELLDLMGSHAARSAEVWQ